MDGDQPQATLINPPSEGGEGLVDKKRIIIIASLVGLLILGGVFAFMIFQKPKTTPTPVAQPTPTPQTGASFTLLASPTEATIGGEIKVSVMVKSDKDPANLFVAKLKFPTDLLQAKAIDQKEASSSGFIKNWFISNWVENTIDNNVGSVSLVGGVPNPGFQTSTESSGSAMADVIFKTKGPGEAKITFDDTSAIYRNFDNSNILGEKNGVTVKIVGMVPIASASAIPTQEITPTSKPKVTPTPTPAGALLGDVNMDGKVDLQDLSAMLTEWGKSGLEAPWADLNKDGLINSFDYSQLLKILKDSGVIQ